MKSFFVSLLAFVRQFFVHSLVLVSAFIGFSPEPADSPVVTVPAMDQQIERYVPLAHRSPQDVHAIRTVSLRRPVRYVFEGKLRSAHLPCAGGTVWVRVLTGAGDQVAMVRTEPDGSYHTVLIVQAIPNEAVDWTLQAQGLNSENFELAGRSISDSEDQIVQLERDLELTPS